MIKFSKITSLPLKEKENDSTACEKFFLDKIGSEINENILYKFAEYLDAHNQNKDNLLYSKLAILSCFRSRDRMRFNRDSKEDDLIKLLKDKEFGCDYILKIYLEFLPCTGANVGVFNTYWFMKNFLHDTFSQVINMQILRTSSDDPQHLKLQIMSLSRCFELLEYVELDKKTFKSLTNETFVKYKYSELEHLKDPLIVKELVKINTKFLNYCQRTIKPLRIENLEYMLLCNRYSKKEEMKLPKLPKNLMINIFAYSVANTNQEADSFADKLRKLSK